MKRTLVFLQLFFCLQISLQCQNANNISFLSGNWESTSGNVFQISLTESGFKVGHSLYKDAYSYYKEVSYQEYSCYDVVGSLWTKQFIGSKIVIVDSINLIVTSAEDNNAYYWIKPDESLPKDNYYVNEAGELFVGGVKIAIIKKTASGSVMLTTMPEFTVYDVKNKPYLLYEKNSGKFMFLDDNKSYIPRQCDAHIKGEYGIAKFIAKSNLFTPTGFNEKYRAFFIKKYNGFDALAVNKSRLRSDPITIRGREIWQSGMVIGYLEVYGQMGSERIYKISSPEKKVISTCKVPSADRYNSIKVSVYIGNSFNNLGFSFSTMNTNEVNDRILKWLVENNYL